VRYSVKFTFLPWVLLLAGRSTHRLLSRQICYLPHAWLNGQALTTYSYVHNARNSFLVPTGMTKYRVDRLITVSTVAQWLLRANHCSKRPRRPHTCCVGASFYVSSSSRTRRAVAGTDRSSSCMVALTSRTFHYRNDRDNADIRTGCLRRLFELLRRLLLVDN